MGHKEEQSVIDLGEPRQNGIDFPTSLAEKYQPRTIEQFIGLRNAKQIIASLLKKPRPCALLFVGPPGAGKTAMGMAFAETLPGSLVHIPAQKCDVAMLDSLNERFAYSMPTGNFWIPLFDEADQMTEKAQLQLLSKLDGTASLKPKFGGGFERGEAPPIIYLFTCNGIGPEQTTPPRMLLPRFVSRCMVIPFEAVSQSDIAEYLKQIWAREGGREGLPAEYFHDLANGVGVRDALMRLDVELLRNLTVAEVEASLVAKVCKAEPETPKTKIVLSATNTVRESKYPQKCQHLDARHHSRGRCVSCYRAFRKEQYKQQTPLSKTWARSSVSVN
jgi:replication-associated recombination protein RarA